MNQKVSIMEAEQSFEVKAEQLNEEKFRIQADEYLDNLETYKKMDKMMRQYESNIKEYMVKNEVYFHENNKGIISIRHALYNSFDRSLVDDIKQYYRETPRVIMNKSLKLKKTTE